MLVMRNLRDFQNPDTHLSFQKALSSSMVLAAPLILVNKTSYPTSDGPQNELQKSKERLLRSGDEARANFANDVVEDCLRAVMIGNNDDNRWAMAELWTIS